MFFSALTFKDSATPFAEALVELHHEIMFYLIVIVSVVIFILVNAINITRVRESYFYSQILSSTAFFKALFLNSFFLPLFTKFLYSSSYLKFSGWLSGVFFDFLYLLISKGGAYLNYFLKIIIFFKSISLNFLNFFGLLDISFSKIFGDYKFLKAKDFLPNTFVSNNFFYKTRNSSSYLTYISNIVSYLNILSIFSDMDYKHFYKNRNAFFSYFYNISSANVTFTSSRALANSLDLVSLDSLYTSNSLPKFNELNSHFSNFLNGFLRSRFSLGNSINFNSARLSNIAPSTTKSLYSFINAQSYTVHNTKLEIIWTVIPTIILIFIAVPSFILLYSLDEVINPSITLKAIGHQ